MKSGLRGAFQTIKGKMTVLSQAQITELIKALFRTQKLAVLATQEPEQPYLSLMAFAATEDLSTLIVATYRGTRKYRNLITAPRVSLLVDSRTNRGQDFAEALAVTILGETEEVALAEKSQFLELFLRRHPQLRDFATSPECALIKVKVEKYLAVRKFQEVLELALPPGD
jgi:nitroimidazol reductase NimA-like FMN-containing flavoprotein (pyridoxamine 5'-phosphate oxidase superfamily)